MNWLRLSVLLAHPGHKSRAEVADGFISQMGDFGAYLVLGLGGLAALIVVALIFFKLQKKKELGESTKATLNVDFSELSTAPPPGSGAQLEIYNVPVRLSLLVLAPVGRDGQIPPNNQLPQVVDAIAPNLMQVMNHHQPDFRRWPPQLSSQGFSQVFFNSVPLPGDGGKNTPWCSLAGRFDTPMGPMLAGLVCVGEKPNALGQVAVAQPGQWLDIVRVKA